MSYRVHKLSSQGHHGGRKTHLQPPCRAKNQSFLFQLMHRLLKTRTSASPPPTPHTFNGSSVVEAPGAETREETRRERKNRCPSPPAPSPSPAAWNTAQAQRSTENNGTLVPGNYGNGQGSCSFITVFPSLCSPSSVFSKHMGEVWTWKATLMVLLETVLEAILRENERLFLEMHIDKRRQ